MVGLRAGEGSVSQLTSCDCSKGEEQRDGERWGEVGGERKEHYVALSGQNATKSEVKDEEED